MKVLIGVDGSDHSFAAVSLAGQLLSPGRDAVALYHSCDAVSFADNVEPSLHERACRAVAGVIFDEAKTRLPAGLQEVETIVGENRDAGAIVEAARQTNAEMIAVGARGLGRMEGLLLGSVSNGVVRHSHVPVLVARLAEKPREEKSLRMLLAYDSVSAGLHADFLGKLTLPPGSTGSVAVVIESLFPTRLPEWIQNRARDADTEAMSQAWVREHEQQREEAHRELSAYAERLPPAFQSAPPLVIEGNPAEQLIKLVHERKPDIIIVGKAMKNFFDRWFVGSVSEKVLSHAKCSVLIIPAVQG
jgi:nucleotide-binding universal stress UspA family protein